MRLLLTPVYPANGERAPGPVYVYTWPKHRAKSRSNRWQHANAGNPVLMTPEGQPRYSLHVMTEDYYQTHRPDGPVKHLGNRVERFAPTEASEQDCFPGRETEEASDAIPRTNREEP